MSISKIKVGSTEHDLHASKLTAARTIALSGDVSGSTTFDGSGNVTITATVADDSHNHVISNVDGLQAALNGKLEKNTSGGVASNNGNGEYNYLKIATIKITSAYINRPIVFEISGRGRGLSLIAIEFSNVNSTDPALSFFISNYDNCFYIKKTTTSTWEIYGEYSEPWGSYTIHRITGCGADIGVTVNMTNIASLPSGCTRVVYGGNVGYATKATQDGSGNVITSTYAAKSHKHSVTAAGTVSSTSITPAGTVSQPTFTGTAHNHTFSGTAVTSGKPDTTNVTTIYSITNVGSLPSHSYTAPSLTGSVENQCLTLTFNAGSHSFSAGTLPTREAISMPNTNHTHSVTAAGTIGSTTAGGTVSQPTFTGTAASHTHTFTGSSVNSSTES